MMSALLTDYDKDRTDYCLRTIVAPSDYQYRCDIVDAAHNLAALAEQIVIVMCHQILLNA